jgi:hypothetical protein
MTFHMGAFLGGKKIYKGRGDGYGGESIMFYGLL